MFPSQSSGSTVITQLFLSSFFFYLFFKKIHILPHCFSFTSTEPFEAKSHICCCLLDCQVLTGSTVTFKCGSRFKKTQNETKKNAASRAGHWRMIRVCGVTVAFVTHKHVGTSSPCCTSRASRCIPISPPPPACFLCLQCDNNKTVRTSQAPWNFCCAKNG